MNFRISTMPVEEYSAAEWANFSTQVQDENLFLAMKYLKYALLLKPNNMSYQRKLAILLARMSRMEEAIEIFCKILDEDSEDRRSYKAMGETLLLQANQTGTIGWFSFFEATFLYRLIKGMDNPAPVIVELGSCFGLSSMIIAKALSDKPDATIYCIDAWEGDGSSVFDKTRDVVRNKAKEGISFFDMFSNNMKKAGVDYQLIPIKSYTTDLAKIWTEKADLLFVDADHSYTGVRNDVRDWKKFVKVGGQILLHDVALKCAGSSEDSAPGRVVNELLGANSKFSSGTLVDSLYLAERLR